MHGTRATWTIAAILAPITAATFTGIIIWTNAHQTKTTTPDPALVALRKKITQDETQITNLQKTIQTLQTQTNKLAKKLNTPTPKPTPTPTKTYTPAPTTHANTGASG